MKINITIDLEDLLKKPLDEVSDDEMEKATNSLPKNVVKLSDEEADVDHPSDNSKPFKYTVKKGDTLKKISEKFGISYGEFCNHLLKKQGTTSIAEGMDIEIPRHFVDLSRA
jgi:LysM repeat protein